MIKGDPTGSDRPLRKLIIAPSERLALLKQLSKMNIHSASLFPGLDGFAGSLRVQLELCTEDGDQRWAESLQTMVSTKIPI